jgi:hypothetical protein
MTTEIHHKGATYRIDNLTAFQQLHVSRRISPLIAPLLPIVQDVESESVSLEDAAAHPWAYHRPAREPRRRNR